MIGHDIAAALPELRRQAESLMTGTCTVDRLNGTTWDEAAQESVPNWETIHTGLPCAFVEPSVSSRTLLTDQTVTAHQPVVKVSVTVEGVLPDDRITVAGVAVVWVTHVPLRTNQVQRRIQCRWSQ